MSGGHTGASFGYMIVLFIAIYLIGVSIVTIVNKLKGKK